MPDFKQNGPGEQKTKARRLRYMAYMGVAFLLGIALSAILNMDDGAASDLFLGNSERALDPTIAIVATGVILISFLGLPVWGFTQIDEHLREQNFVSFTGGALAVLCGYPAWAVLSAGGFLTRPTAFGVFALAFLASMVTFAVVKLRDRFS